MNAINMLSQSEGDAAWNAACAEVVATREASAKLATAIAAYRQKKAASDAHWDDVECPASEAYNEACTLVLHRTTLSSYVDQDGKEIRFSTDDGWSASLSRRLLADMGDKADRHSDRAFIATLREIVALEDQRAAEKAAIATRLRISEISDASDVLLDEVCDAQADIFMSPAGCIADLAAKLEFVDDDSTWERFRDEITADIKRLAGVA